MTQLKGTGAGAAIHIMGIDADAQIAHEWVVGWANE
jgi:hypothetical protein